MVDIVDVKSNSVDHIVVRLLEQLSDEYFVLAAFEPTADDYTGHDDKADVYAIVSNLEADGGCMIYGFSKRRDEWVANWSCRHAVRYLLDTISLIRAGWSIHDVSETINRRMNGHRYVGASNISSEVKK